MRGGEIRLVITLCASDDKEGAALGAKVTPWQPVPVHEAPQWRAREAVFAVAAERCFEASFVDSAHLHIVLMQKDAEKEKPTGLGFSALKQQGLTALRAAPLSGLLDLGGGARGESIGELKLPVGRRLACGQGGEGAEWVQLHGEGVVKGSLLLELSCAGDGRSPAKLPAPEPAKLPAPAPALPPAPLRREPERPEQKVWEELPEASPAQEPGGAKPPPASWRLEALEALEASLKTKEPSKVQAPDPEPQPRPVSAFEEPQVNIFNINEGSGSKWKWSTWRGRFSHLPSFDPGVRQQRREVQKWRQWHEVFCILNEMEHRSNEVVVGLRQADTSMQRFGRSYGSDALQDACRLPAFFSDAAAYYRSEAAAPGRLEAALGRLEQVAEEFRATHLESSAEDLQVDIAVLLESLVMGAHQALGEYKKMHCRVELVAKEYEPLSHMEISRPAFLPLAEEQVVALPEQAVHWAMDFSQLVENASKTLNGLVRELHSRKGHLGDCLAELRALLLRQAAAV